MVALNADAECFRLACSYRTCAWVVFGGYNGSSNTTRIQYIAIQSLGNATDFGVLSRAMSQGAAVSSSTRGVTAGGADHTGAAVNSIDYVTIASTGNSTDFGDLNATSIQNSGVSNNTRGLDFFKS